MKKRIIIALTGASGIQYGIQLLEQLRTTQMETHLIVSEAAKLTNKYETETSVSYIESLADFVYNNKDIYESVASGSFKTLGMIIVPCSINTMSKITYSINDNLIIRAADVCLKERRKLIVVVRETPLHAGHLESMLKLTQMGAVIFPPVPALYAKPSSINEMIDHTVGRILDTAGIENALKYEWSSNKHF